MREHGYDRTIRLCDRRPRQVDLPELDLVPPIDVAFVTSMLVALVKNEVRVLVHKLLHRILYELVERVELLPDETFLLEEAGDHRPAVFLSNWRKVLIVFFLSIVGVIEGIVVLRELYKRNVSRSCKCRNADIYLDS